MRVFREDLWPGAGGNTFENHGGGDQLTCNTARGAGVWSLQRRQSAYKIWEAAFQAGRGNEPTAYPARVRRL